MLLLLLLKSYQRIDAIVDYRLSVDHARLTSYYYCSLKQYNHNINSENN